MAHPDTPLRRTFVKGQNLAFCGLKISNNLVFRLDFDGVSELKQKERNM